jgi:ELWxxDGT repeat protein
MFLTSIGATLYFTADDGVHGRELWRSDGTEAGTVMVKEIAAGAPSSDPLYLANANGTLYLVADDGMNGSSLWKSDGTAAGTARLSSAILGVIPVDYGQGLAAALYFGGSTYFFGQDAGGRALFKTDGTEAGTVRITAVGSLESVKSAAEVDGLLFFNDGDQLWKTDGTAAGTTLVLDLRPVLGSPSLFELTDVAGTLFFRGSDGASGEELWRSDGTSAGTVMVKDINPGGGGAALNDLKNVNGTLFFRADDGVHGREPWESDGTDAGTVMIRDINPGAAHSLGSPSFQAVNGAVYFVVASGGASGSGFWKTDGTPAGTVLVKQVVIQSSLFTAQDKIYFAGDDSGINGYELWRSDGTAAGTAMLQNIAPGAASSLPSPFVPAGSLLFFAASDDATATNRELWALATASPPPARLLHPVALPAHRHPQPRRSARGPRAGRGRGPVVHARRQLRTAPHGEGGVRQRRGDGPHGGREPPSLPRGNAAAHGIRAQLRRGTDAREQRHHRPEPFRRGDDPMRPGLGDGPRDRGRERVLQELDRRLRAPEPARRAAGILFDHRHRAGLDHVRERVCHGVGRGLVGRLRLRRTVLPDARTGRVLHAAVVRDAPLADPRAGLSPPAQGGAGARRSRQHDRDRAVTLNRPSDLR